MNRSDTVIFGLFGFAIAGIVAWVVTVSARLGAFERALQSVEGNTSLPGGIRGVFGSRDRRNS